MSETIKDIAKLVEGELVGHDELVIESLEELEAAREGQLSFIGNSEYAGKWAKASASAALVNKGIELEPGDGRALVFVENADLAMAKVLDVFAPAAVKVNDGIHATAAIDESAILGENVSVGPNVYVGAGVTVGANTVIHANVSIMDHVEIGDDCEIWPGVVIRERCKVGSRCILHANCTIGVDGFGYRVGQGENGPKLVKIPQIGIVEIQDDCEIGANTAIDRAKFSATVIGAGTKIDNMVQIGHNCTVGKMCALSGATGVAGSVKIGNGVTIGGMCAIKDHIAIGDGATLGGASQVIGNVPAGVTWVGAPARDYSLAIREYALIRKLPDMYKQLRKLLKSK